MQQLTLLASNLHMCESALAACIANWGDSIIYDQTLIKMLKKEKIVNCSCLFLIELTQSLFTARDCSDPRSESFRDIVIHQV